MNLANAVLSESDVRWVLDKYFTDDVDQRLTQRQIAKALKVGRDCIGRIVRGEAWGHVSEPYLEHKRLQRDADAEQN